MTTAEETRLYQDYKNGHIYENISYGILNKPPGWYSWNGGRWTNSLNPANITLEAWSQDEAWDVWYKSVGGIQGDPAIRAAEEAARLAAEKATADALAAEQLRLKQEMLNSESSTWAAGFQADAAATVAAEIAATGKIPANLIPERGIPISNLLGMPKTGCPDGTTRKVQCPKDPNKIVTQQCVNGAWVTLPADEKACEKTDQAKMIIAAVIIAIILISLFRKK